VQNLWKSGVTFENNNKFNAMLGLGPSIHEFVFEIAQKLVDGRPTSTMTTEFRCGPSEAGINISQHGGNNENNKIRRGSRAVLR
jgi:hypothetical protein